MQTRKGQEIEDESMQIIENEIGSHSYNEKEWPMGIKKWQEKSPLGKLVNPQDVANTVVFLASEFSHSINGENITVDTGMSCVQAW